MTDRRTLTARLAALALALLAPGLAAAESQSIQASGNVVKESRAHAGFTGISLAVPGKLELRQGSPESVTIEADDNVLPKIETTVERNRLVIRLPQKLSISGRPTIRIAVTAPRIEAISVAGSGDVVAQSLATPTLALAVSGSGDVKIADLQVDTLNASIAGSGDIQAGGRAGEVNAKIAGSGDFDTGKVDAKRVSVTIAGSGDAVVRAAETLKVTIAGSGDVRYHGNPTVEKKVAGSGRVRPAS